MCYLGENNRKINGLRAEKVSADFSAECREIDASPAPPLRPRRPSWRPSCSDERELEARDGKEKENDESSFEKHPLEESEDHASEGSQEIGHDEDERGIAR